MAECLECGEPAKNIHPEYFGDRLCNECFIRCHENIIETSFEYLREAEDDTGIMSEEYPREKDE